MKIPYRNQIVHDTGKSNYPGPYELTDLALKRYNIAREKFGSTEILIPTGKNFTVKDYQYELPDGSIGMHFIPVSDAGSVLNSNNQYVSGASLIDEFLREVMQLTKDEPIYAFINYFHPEQNKGDIKYLASKDKVEMGFTHLGAYYGQGYTSNAPMLYHGHRFGVDGKFDNPNYGYPANVQIISLQNVPQATLNKNFRYVDTCLNNGVMFPNKSPLGYMDSMFRVVDINTALMFYRDWIMFEQYLRTDDTWYTYCAAHKTVITTVALNLPHNLKSFQEVYGIDEGKDLFDQFKLFYNNIIGPDPGFLATDETDFVPLWKMEGFTPSQISPFTRDEYFAYDKARRERSLNSFTGKKPLYPDQATGWAPQSSAEVIFVFMQVYADMLDAGSIITCASILAFMDQIDHRMGISKAQYLLHAMPIINYVMIADATVNAANDPDNYLKNTFTGLCLAFGGTPADALDFESEIKKVSVAKSLQDFEQLISTNPVAKVLAAWALMGVVSQWSSIVKAGSVAPVDAYVKMMESIHTDLEKVRDMVVTQPDRIQFNTPPTTTHLLSNGMHKTNPFITVKEVCTVVDFNDVQLKVK